MRTGPTTQLIATISSPDTISDVSATGTDAMSALAANLQPVAGRLDDVGISKIVLISRMQQITLEQEIADLLSGVDVIIDGGSDTF